MRNTDTCIFPSMTKGSLAVREKGDHTALIHRQEILVIPPIAYWTQTATHCGCDRIERTAGQIDLTAFVLPSQVRAKEMQYFV
jgi:hypothetical protein